jgi:hypothetical protein
MQQRFVCVFSTLCPWASLRDFKLLQRSQDASGSAMSDAPRPPPPLPQNALIWDRTCSAPVGLGPCSMARMVVKKGTLVRRTVPGTPNH